MNRIWLNLPVKDIEESKKFYREIGFRLNPLHENRDDVAGLLLGEKDFVVMLFPEETFQQYAGTNTADTSKAVETLLSFDVDSREEVKTFVAKVEQAGGNVFSKPEEHDDMYGAGFTDPDGHRWNILYMGEFVKKETS